MFTRRPRREGRTTGTRVHAPTPEGRENYWEGRGPRPPPLPARAGARVGADMRRTQESPAGLPVAATAPGFWAGGVVAFLPRFSLPDAPGGLPPLWLRRAA